MKRALVTTKESAKESAPRDVVQAIRDVFGYAADEHGRSRSLAEIAGAALECTSATQVVIASKTLDGSQLEITASAGAENPVYVGLRFSIENSASARSLATGETTVTRDAAPIRGAEQKGSPEPSATVCVPVRTGQSWSGVLMASFPDFEFAAAQHIETLKTFAALVPLIQDLYDLSNRCSDQGRELALLYDCGERINAGYGSEQVMQALMTAIWEHLRPRSAALYLLNDDATHLLLAAERGLEDAQVELQLPVESTYVAHVLQGKPVILTSTQFEEELPHLVSNPPVQSAIIAGVMSRSDPMGIVLLTSTESRGFDEQDLKLLTMLCTHAGSALDAAFLFEDESRRQQRTAALYELSRELSATRSLDKILNSVADHVIKLLGVESLVIQLFNERNERLETHLCRNADESVFDAYKPRVGEGIPGWTLQWEITAAVTDLAGDTRDKSAPLEGFQSVVCTPISSNQEYLGVLMVLSGYRRSFTTEEVQVIETIAHQCALSLENAFRYQDARVKSDTMRTYFKRVANTIGLIAEGLPDPILDLIASMMQADRCAVYAVDGEQLELRAARRFRVAAQPDAVIPIGVGLAGWVARRSRSLVVEDLAADPRAASHAWLTRDRLGSYLGVPLKDGHRTIGVFEVYTIEPRNFRQAEVNLLTQFLRHAQIGKRLTPTIEPTI